MNPALEKDLIRCLSLAETFIAEGQWSLAAQMLFCARVILAKLEARR